MHPELWSEPYIGSYSAFLLLSFLAGYLLARRNAARAGIAGRHIDNQTLLIVVISLIGARVFSWIFYFPAGVSFWKALFMPGGGMVFYGGLVFAIGSVIAYSLIARLPLKEIFDLWAAPLALGLAIGRIGCFLAGCCWGDLCVEQVKTASLPAGARWQVHSLPWWCGPNLPLAVQFPAGTGAHEQHQKLGLIDPVAERSLPVHPAQLYEAMAVLALSIFLQRRFQKRPAPGAVMGLLGVGYGTIRFLVEFFRADNAPVYVGLTLSQVISLSFIAGGVWLLRRSKAGKPQTLVERCDAIESDSVALGKRTTALPRN